MKNCVNCGAGIAEEDIMCPVCGSPADEMVMQEEPSEETFHETPEETPETVEGSVEETAEEAAADEMTEAAAEETAQDEPAETEDAGEAADEAADVPAEKPKNRWTWLTTIIVIVTALILLGLVGVVLYKDGTLQKWWEDIRPKTKSAFTMEDYSEIQVLRSAVEIDDAEVDDYVMSLVSGELTDEAAANYAAAHSDCDATNIEELKEYAHDYIYDYYLHNEMMEYLKSITTVTSYDEVQEAALIEYAAEQLEYTASNYGMDVDTIASYSGYESALAYETETAHEYQTISMILDKILKDKGISYTQDELNSDIVKYLDDSGYSEYYSVDEFLEMVGDTWVFLYENLTYKFNLAMEALEPNVVFIDEPAE